MEWIYISIGIVVSTLIIATLLSLIFNEPVVVKTKLYDKSNIKGTIFYYLPESLVKITGNSKIAVVYNEETKSFYRQPYLVEQIFSCSSELIADTENLFILDYIPNPMMADEIKFGINSKGLLKTVDVTTTDRTSAIIAKLTDTASGMSTMQNYVKTSPKLSIKFKHYIEEFVIKSSDLEKANIQWNILVTNELNQEDFVFVDADFKVSITNYKTDPNNQESTPVPAKVDGILTRPLRFVQLSFQSVFFEDVSPLTLNLSVIDSTKLVNVPIKRGTFIKRVNKVIVQDGIIVSNEINNPSSVEGFLSIPVNIAKAIVSIPAQIISFRYDNTKKLNEREIELMKQEINKSKLTDDYMNTNMNTNGQHM